MLNDFINSFHFNWYSKFLARSKVYKLFYLFIFIFLSFLVMLVPLYMRGMAVWNSKDFQNIPNMVADNYPNGLEVTVNSNGWSINQSQPYSIPLNVNNFKGSVTDKLPKNIITFSKTATFDDFAKFDTVLLLTENNLIAKDENGNVKASDISDAYKKLTSEIVVNKDKVNTWTNDYWNKVKNFVTGGGIIGLLFVCCCFAVGVLYVAGLAYAMVIAFIVWLINAMFKFAREDLEYGTVLTTTIFAYGVWAIVDGAMNLIFRMGIPLGPVLPIVMVAVIVYMSFPKSQPMMNPPVKM